MKITRIIVGSNKTNCYIITCTETNKSAIIDPGEEPIKILDTLKNTGTTATAMLATHGDYDQVMAAGKIQTELGIPLYIHSADHDLLNIIPSVASYASDTQKYATIPNNVVHIKNNDVFAIGKIKLFVFLTSGHTAGSVSYYALDSQAIFVGDVINPQSSQAQLNLSLASTVKLISSIKHILDLPQETLILSSHLPPSNVETQRKYWQRILKY